MSSKPMELAPVSVNDRDVAEKAKNNSISLTLPREQLESLQKATSNIEVKSIHGGCERTERCCKFLRRRRTEMVSAILIVVAVIACVLFASPSVYYLIPAELNPASNEVAMASECSPLASSTCKDILLQLKNCLPVESDEVYVSSAIGQGETEVTAMGMISGLNFLNPSPTCLEMAERFLCLYLFPLCDVTNTTYHPTYNECVALTTDICQREWQMALQLNSDLPKCSDFEDVQPICSNKSNTSIVPLDSNNSAVINCSDHFFLQEGFCRPICSSWPGTVSSVVRDVISATATSIGIIAGILVLIISCLRRRRMCVFPSTLVIYVTVTFLFYGPLVLISFVDRDGLYCSSENLIESLQKSTVFCSIAGSIYFYVLLQLSLWCFFHVAILFWKVFFPFHANTQQKLNRLKYIHATIVVLALLLPFVPVTASLATQGFVIGIFPPLLCQSRSVDVAFYTLVVPVTFLAAIGISMLLAVLWKAMKVKLQHSNDIGTAEKKMMIVILYYFCLVSVDLIAFTLNIRGMDFYIAEVSTYFACESKGNGSCPTGGYDAHTYPEIDTLGLSILGFFPAINLVYALNLNELKSICKRQFRLSSNSDLKSSIKSAKESWNKSLK